MQGLFLKKTNKMETNIEQSLNMTHFVQVWKNQWVIFSEHKFKSDAVEIRNLLNCDMNMEYIKDKIQELNKTAKNILIDKRC